MKVNYVIATSKHHKYSYGFLVAHLKALHKADYSHIEKIVIANDDFSGKLTKKDLKLGRVSKAFTGKIVIENVSHKASIFGSWIQGCEKFKADYYFLTEDKVYSSVKISSLPTLFHHKVGAEGYIVNTLVPSSEGPIIESGCGVIDSKGVKKLCEVKNLFEKISYSERSRHWETKFLFSKIAFDAIKVVPAEDSFIFNPIKL